MPLLENACGDTGNSAGVIWRGKYEKGEQEERRKMCKKREDRGNLSENSGRRNKIIFGGGVIRGFLIEK